MARVTEVEVKKPLFPKEEEKYEKVLKDYLTALKLQPYEEPTAEE